MRVRVTIGVFLVVVLTVLATAPVRAGRSITLPHSEAFSSATSWADLKWASQGAVGQHVSGAQVWDGGGAARFFLPTANQGYAGLGQFSFAQTARVNVRFVLQWTQAFMEDDIGVGPKHLIVNRTGSDTRFIAQMHGFDDTPQRWDLGLGNGISPWYPNPRVWDYSEHAGQPVCFEFEAVVGGSYKVWITKRTGTDWNERLLITVPSATGGAWSMIDILGAFGGPGRQGAANPNAYFQISNLAISTTYIGPPAGFRSGSTPQCVYSLASPSASVPVEGSTGMVGLTTDAGCPWNVTSSATWVTVATDTGTGPATLSYTVAANTTTARTATLSVNGQTFTVNQAGVVTPPPPPSCTFSLTPTSANVSATSSTGSVAVGISPSGCAPSTWTVSGAPAWMTATASGTSVSYSVQANTQTTSRTASLLIANQPFPITQAAAAAPPNGCHYQGTTYPPGTIKRLQPTNASFDSTAMALEAAGWELQYPYVYILAKCPKP